MIRKFFFLFILIIVGQLAFSQEKFIRTSVGIARTGVLQNSPDANFVKDEFKTRFLLQASYNQKINENFYWGTGLGFFQKGFKFDMEFFDEFANPMGVEILDWRFNYVGLPSYLEFQSGGELLFFADIGLTPSILINSELKQPDFTGSGIATDVTEFVDNFDLSFNSVIGVRRKINDYNSIEVGLSFQQSLIGVEFANIIVSDNAYNHIVLAFMVGLTHQL